MFSTAPPPAATAPQAPFRHAVELDPSGHGDARTIADALAMVEDGGVIYVRPGRYRGSLQITKPVTIVGSRMAGDQPVFESMTINTAGDVRLEAIEIESAGELSALRIDGGEVSLVDCTITASALGRDNGSMTGAITATGGDIQISGGAIGPGGDAAVLAYGTANVTIVRGARIDGRAGYGLFATSRARLSVSDSRISGRIAAATHQQARISLRGNTVIGTPAESVLVVNGNAPSDITGNRIFVLLNGELAGASSHNWLRRAPNASQLTGDDNFSGDSNRELSLAPGGPRRRRS